MPFLTEADIEAALLAELAALGYQTTTEAEIDPDGRAPERAAFSDVLLRGRLQAAIDRLNPTLPADARTEALRQVLATVAPSLIEENRRLQGLLSEGVKIEYTADDGTQRGGRVWLIDIDTPENNDWLAVQQFTVIEAGHQRRADVVLFVNGLPLVVVELKSPSSEQATLQTAYQQFQTYKAEIPSLFRTNAALVISDGQRARIGSLTANAERFMRWRTIDGATIAPEGTPEQPVLVQGVLARDRLLTLLRDFTTFGRTDAGLIKILAGYHQYHAVLRAVDSTLRALALTDANRPAKAAERRPDLQEDPAAYGLPGVTDYQRGDRRIGVIWHTQGSGKSLLMAFYVGQLVRHPAMTNPTILVITDRNDLDDQLFATFAMCQDLIRQTPEQADSRADLRTALQRASGGVIFTTIQKFAPEPGNDHLPMLSDRRNIIVIADEAHRSQYGLKAKVDTHAGKVAYGFAKHLRDALPNASFIGFTGTPIEAIDWILTKQHEAGAREADETAKKRAHRRYQDAVLQLSKAYALASASEEAEAIRDEVGFFQAIRAALVKSQTGTNTHSAERDTAVAQLIDRSVVSTEIVDILGAAGIRSPDLSILSDEFLAEIAQTKQQNLALEALRKLLNDQVRSRSKRNVAESRRFSERLEDAIARYHTNAVSTVEVLQELIDMAKDLRAAQARGEEEGLSEDELAFYDALAANQSAVEVMGSDDLKVIAHELLIVLQGNITVDWAHRENARAKMRVLVKRILKKYGYPPDLQAAAVQTVLAQAEVWSERWAA